MSATIVPRPVTLKENVTLAFRNLQVIKTKCSKNKDYSSLGLVVKVFVLFLVVVAVVVASSIDSLLGLRFSIFVCFQDATLNRKCMFLNMSENR